MAAMRSPRSETACATASQERDARGLGRYKGTHKFHNFGSGKKPTDGDVRRYIVSFATGAFRVCGGIEYVELLVPPPPLVLSGHAASLTPY